MAIPSHFSFLSCQSHHRSLSILLPTDRMFPPKPLRVSCITTQHNSKRASCSLTGKAYCIIRSLLPFLDCPFILRCQIRPVCFSQHCEICLVASETQPAKSQFFLHSFLPLLFSLFSSMVLNCGDSSQDGLTELPPHQPLPLPWNQLLCSVNT